MSENNKDSGTSKSTTPVHVMSAGILLMLAGALLTDLAAMPAFPYFLEWLGCAAFLGGGVALLSS
jgi:hypothetical protein